MINLNKEPEHSHCENCNARLGEGVGWTIEIGTARQSRLTRLCIDCLRKLYTLLDVNSEVNP